MYFKKRISVADRSVIFIVVLWEISYCICKIPSRFWFNVKFRYVAVGWYQQLRNVEIWELQGDIPSPFPSPPSGFFTVLIRSHIIGHLLTIFNVSFIFSKLYFLYYNFYSVVRFKSLCDTFIFIIVYIMLSKECLL